MRLSNILRRTCAKVIDSSTFESLREETILVLCHMERVFPPSLFDITTHLLLHVVEEIRLCGPVSLRWMYPFEREMKKLKIYVKNCAQPEGSIAEGYSMEEAMGFSTEYWYEFEGSSKRVWDADKSFITPTFDEANVGGRRSPFVLSPTQLHQAHLCILENSKLLAPWREIFDDEAKASNRKKSGTLIFSRDFPNWISKKVTELAKTREDIDAMLYDLTRGPLQQAFSYSSLNINGYHFRTMSTDIGKVTQDSGVAAYFDTWSRSSVKDKNLARSRLRFFGHIESIVEVDYGSFNTTLLYCNWYKSDTVGKNASVKMDAYGFQLVDTSKLLRSSDLQDQPFVMPEHVQQVFYVPDQVDPMWSVVMQHIPRRRHMQDDNDDFVDFSTSNDFACPMMISNESNDVMEECIDGGDVVCMDD